MINKFEKFNLNKDIIKCLDKMKYIEPSKVQEEVIPEILSNKDIIVKSKTGSGKTASFGIPMCEGISVDDNSVQGLVIAPTRELALQIKEEIQSIGRMKKVRCSAIFGKQPLKEQVSQLKQRVHIVVATPGRIIDHIGRGTIDLSNIKYFIIDEADKMLNKGFIEDMESILNKLPKTTLKGLFSATIDENIDLICNKYMTEPKKIEIEEDAINNKKQISEFYIKVNDKNRYETLKNVIYANSPKSLIIFANTRDNVDKLYKSMKNDKFLVKEIHGDMSQDKRLFIIKDFKENKFNILVSSDITARGIHIDDIAMVINYEVPRDKENYVHRIGRTGRVDKEGIAVTLVSEKEEKYLQEIENYTNNKIDEIIDINQSDIELGKIKLHKIQSNLQTKRKENKLSVNESEEITKIYLNAGKKKKIRVIDIVGALSNIPGINNEDIGVIEVKDVCSYVDLLNFKGREFLKNNKSIIIKKKEVKVRKDKN